jgi:RNA polymerase sigma-70 factor (ECF subfamily)
MTNPTPKDLTEIIRLAGEGNTEARDQAASLVYEEIKRNAAWMMRSERNVTLQPTALVNEALMRLLGGDAMAEAPNRAYFFAAAAQTMRRILVDECRRRKALKRGGQHERQPFDEVLSRYDEQNIDVLALDEAIQELERISPRQAKIVQLRWFMEMKVKEVAELLDISVSTVEQEWRLARAFLRQQLDSA